MPKRRPKLFPLLPVNLTHVVTVDGIDLSGVVVEPRGRKRAALIWLHGLTSSFDSGQELMRQLSQACVNHGIGYFKFNTRGHHLVDYGSHTAKQNGFVGASHEKFADTTKDILAIISLARRRGYTKFILAGHSTGAQKVLYYYAKQHDPRINGLILAGPASDIAGELKRIRPYLLLRRLEQARRRATKHPNELVPKSWGPWSNQRYISLFTPGSVEEVFPYHRLGGRWTFLKNARLPIVMISGERDQYLDQPAKKIMQMFRNQATKSKSFHGIVIPGADHGFRRHQRQLTKHIITWIDSIL